MESGGGPVVAAYLRDSPAERAAGRLDTAQQREEIDRFLAYRGWEIATVFDDSGAAGAAPQLEAALSRSPYFDKLVVAQLDRLAGGPRPLEKIIGRFAEGGVDVVSVREDIDTGTDAGRAALRMLALLASWQPRGRETPGGGARPEGLQAHGFSPATVIDVGAGHGTGILLEAFPDAHHVLIEPLEEFAPELARVLQRHHGELVQAAIGDVEGPVTINVDPTLFMSSIRKVGRPRTTQPREVALRTLDSLLTEREWKPPFGLKIDTEGYEREVVKGAKRVLEQCEFVLAEVSVASRFEGDCSAAEFIALMRDVGMEPVDVLDAARGLGGSQADLLFRRVPA